MGIEGSDTEDGKKNTTEWAKMETVFKVQITIINCSKFQEHFFKPKQDQSVNAHVLLLFP